MLAKPFLSHIIYGFIQLASSMHFTNSQGFFITLNLFSYSPDFRNIAMLSLRKMVDMLMEDIASSFNSTSSSEVPLARLLPRVAQIGSPMLEDPTNNKFIHAIQSSPEVELFYTLLYSNMPPGFWSISHEMLKKKPKKEKKGTTLFKALWHSD